MDETSVLGANTPHRCAFKTSALLLFPLLSWANANRAQLNNCSAALEVTPRAEKLVLQEGHCIDRSNFIIDNRNAGERPLLLVKPGDGSQCGLRTPTVKWSVLDAQGLDRQDTGTLVDDTINPLQADEIFRLNPGEAFDLSAWIPSIAISIPGTYKVVLRYRNDQNAGGQLKLIASIEESQLIAKILSHLERAAPEQSRSELSLTRRGPPAQSSLL